MIDFALTKTIPTSKDPVAELDIALDEAGNFIFVTGAYCVQQMIECALLLSINEYEYNTQTGISWQIAMQTGYQQIPLLQYQIQQTIYAQNNYIGDTTLQIKNVQQTNYSFNAERQLTLYAIVTLNNNTILEVNVANG